MGPPSIEKDKKPSNLKRLGTRLKAIGRKKNDNSTDDSSSHSRNFSRAGSSSSFLRPSSSQTTQGSTYPKHLYEQAQNRPHSHDGTTASKRHPDPKTSNPALQKSQTQKAKQVHAYKDSRSRDLNEVERSRRISAIDLPADTAPRQPHNPYFGLGGYRSPPNAQRSREMSSQESQHPYFQAQSSYARQPPPLHEHPAFRSQPQTQEPRNRDTDSVHGDYDVPRPFVAKTPQLKYSYPTKYHHYPKTNNGNPVQLQQQPQPQQNDAAIDVSTWSIQDLWEKPIPPYTWKYELTLRDKPDHRPFMKDKCWCDECRDKRGEKQWNEVGRGVV